MYEIGQYVNFTLPDEPGILRGYVERVYPTHWGFTGYLIRASNGIARTVKDRWIIGVVGAPRSSAA